MNALATQAGTGRSMRPGHRECAGFTLVEILITAAVTIVAFTGLASLQVLSVRAADSALERTQATALAQSMVERLRLNRGGKTNGATALGGAYNGTMLCDRQDQWNDGCTDGDGELTGTDKKTVDLREWWKDAKAFGLSGWYAGIQQNDDIFRVAVRWDDTRSENNASSAKEVHESCLGDELLASTQEVCVVTQL